MPTIQQVANTVGIDRANVRLVDLKKTPIEKITETGLETSTEKFEFDLLIYATGFDAVTGSFVSEATFICLFTPVGRPSNLHD